MAGILARTIDATGGKDQGQEAGIVEETTPGVRKTGLTRRAICAKKRLKLSTLDYWFS
jgi:hypothetical protein